MQIILPGRGTGEAISTSARLKPGAELPLKRYLTADGLISFRLTRRLSAFAAVENIFDADIESGRTPVLTLAAPRAARLGLRLELGKN